LLVDIKQVLFTTATHFFTKASKNFNVMKKFTQNREETKKTEKKHRRLFAGKSLRKHEVIAGVAISVFAFLHFVSPFILTENKVTSTELPPVVTENKVSLTIEPNIEPKNADIVKPPSVPVSRTAQTEATKSSSPGAMTKKKQQTSRESRAERLRRAERILTGA
jgi:hypothetical protein